MTATYDDISGWFDEAKRKKCAYLIIGLDPFDHDNFPCYCQTEAEAVDKVKSLISSGNGFDEVYDMSLPKAAQMAEHRTRHLPNLDKIVAEAARTRTGNMWSGSGGLNGNGFGGWQGH